MLSNPNLRLLAALVLATTTSVACEKMDDAAAIETIDGTESVQLEAALLQAAADSVAALFPLPASGTAFSSDVELRLAAKASEVLPTLLNPLGCAGAILAGNTLVIDFTDCRGRYGLGPFRGSAYLTFTTLSAGSISIDMTGERLTGNGATLQFGLTSTAQYAADGARTVTVTSTGGGTGARGTAVNRSANYVVTWSAGDACFTINGSWSALGVTRPNATRLDAVKSCGADCPASGTATRVYPAATTGDTAGETGSGEQESDEVAATVTFDGSPEAKFETPRQSGTFTLHCGAESGETTGGTAP
jgi:hypothetical protein